RAERDGSAALQEAMALYGRADGAGQDFRLWAEALAAAKHAEWVAAAGDAPPDLRDRALALVREIERREKNQRLIVTLRHIQAGMGDDLQPNGDQDFPAANRRYAAAFETFDLNPD